MEDIMIKKLTLAAGVSVLAASAAFAGGHCNGAGVASLSAAFPAVEAVQDQMEACGATTERDQEHKDKINPALA
ncbi:MAG: hypothetical protein AAF675_17950, partial [Pseudomonadota bacterium]